MAEVHEIIVMLADGQQFKVTMDKMITDRRALQAAFDYLYSETCNYLKVDPNARS